MIKRTLLLGSLLSVILFGIFYLFTKNLIKSGITTTLLLLVLFNYGVLYELIELLYYSDNWPFKNIHRYLLGLVIFLTCIIIWAVQKKVQTGIRINYFLNLLILLLLFFNLAKLSFQTVKISKNNIAEIEKIKNHEVSENLPNIYYIVLDGYANQHVLKKYYQFDNSDFINYLKSNKFYIADSSTSNYYSTLPSLAATLNMDYLNTSNAEERRSILLNNRFFNILKSNGYTLYKLQSGYSVTNGFTKIDSNIVINGPNEFERSILKFTIFRLDDLIGMVQHLRLKSQFEKLNEVAEIKRSRRFIFIHIVAPHPPFVFNSKGEQIYNGKHQDNAWEPKENYVGQLIYLNTVIRSFISKVVTNDRSGVIILQSDHGPWIQSPDENVVYQARSMILNAMRYPHLNDSLFTNSISSINTFRFFVKHHIDPFCKMLNDSAAGKAEILSNILFVDRKRK